MFFMMFYSFLQDYTNKVCVLCSRSCKNTRGVEWSITWNAALMVCRSIRGQYVTTIKWYKWHFCLLIARTVYICQVCVYDDFWSMDQCLFMCQMRSQSVSVALSALMAFSTTGNTCIRAESAKLTDWLLIWHINRQWSTDQKSSQTRTWQMYIMRAMTRQKCHFYHSMVIT